MRIFFDTEFIEDGKTIELISIGLVRDDGKELYLESDRVDWSKANPWVLENVRPHLKGEEFQLHPDDIIENVVRFCGKQPEFWAYYADYDWVLLCQMFGSMMQLPRHWPMFCMDLKQLAVMLGSPQLPEPKGTEHNALDDARWNAEVYSFLVGYQHDMFAFGGDWLATEPHDHDAMLKHLLDEWGSLGTVMQVCEKQVTPTLAKNMLEMALKRLDRGKAPK